MSRMHWYGLMKWVYVAGWQSLGGDLHDFRSIRAAFGSQDQLFLRWGRLAIKWDSSGLSLCLVVPAAPAKRQCAVLLILQS